MSSNPLRTLWQKWKALPLPWRRQFLAGTDLHGNTYWQFRPADPNSPRMRRMAKPFSRNIAYADYQAQISPVWHQWLRHTRDAAPTLQEQEDDVRRQVTLKANARLADQRWESKKRYIEGPVKGGGKSRMAHQEETIAHLSGTRMEMGDAPVGKGMGEGGEQRASEWDRLGDDRKQEAQGSPGTATDTPAQDPWEAEKVKQKGTAANPGGEWQPEAWTPPPRKR